MCVGADLAARDEDGATPLHKAAYAGQTKVVQLLVSKGAEVDSQDNEDGTPLHNACFTGHLECAKLLLSSQANLNCADAKGAYESECLRGFGCVSICVCVFAYSLTFGFFLFPPPSRCLSSSSLCVQWAPPRGYFPCREGCTSR